MQNKNNCWVDRPRLLARADRVSKAAHRSLKKAGADPRRAVLIVAVTRLRLAAALYEKAELSIQAERSWRSALGCYRELENESGERLCRLYLLFFGICKGVEAASP
jgi:hypothetical protein